MVAYTKNFYATSTGNTCIQVSDFFGINPYSTLLKDTSLPDLHLNTLLNALFNNHL